MSSVPPGTDVLSFLDHFASNRAVTKIIPYSLTLPMHGRELWGFCLSTALNVNLDSLQGTD
jgi:hypothetical protein